MTGTSLDGIDLVLAEVVGHGPTMRARLLPNASASLSAPLGELAPRLRAAAQQEPLTAREFAALALDLGELHAQLAHQLCTDAGVRPVLAALHGQTICHAPPHSWQLLNPWPVVAALQCPVVHDLRGADLAEGGQGAPLTPLADWILFRREHPVAVVNLGGFANATFLPAERPGEAPPLQAIRGADLCPCNQLLDQAARERLHRPYDDGGAVALRGTPDAEAVGQIARAIAANASPETSGSPRSLGTGDEAWPLLHAWRTRMSAPDLLATLSEAIGLVIGNVLRAPGAAPEGVPTQLLLAGGGARHERLVRAIRNAAGVPVTTTDATGVPPAAREALGWAALGALAQDGMRIALPEVTGRAENALADGCWAFPRAYFERS